MLFKSIKLAYLYAPTTPTVNNTVQNSGETCLESKIHKDVLVSLLINYC